MTTATMMPEHEGGTWKEKGLYSKYNVIDTFSGDMVKEDSFTLMYRTDPHAKAAMLAYARSIQNDNPTLAHDIWSLWPDTEHHLT